MPTFVLSRIESFQIVYAKPGRKAESDAYLNAAKDEAGRPALRVWDEAFWRKRTEKMLENLPTILNAVVGSISVIVALVVVLLALIAFQARSDEFALLLAVGITRRRLAGKVLLEHLLCAAGALVLGLGLGYGFLAWWDVAVLAPKAILIDFFAPYPLALAATLPLVAAAASAAILTLRLRRMDPVAILQRRNA
jgi:ABC-type antimicrobial peptide transport system permease subunit